MMKGTNYITPIGSVLAVVCFFLPWLDFSFADEKMNFSSISGYDLIAKTFEIHQALNHSYNWITNPILISLICAVVILLICYYKFRQKKTLYQVRGLILALSVIGLGVLIYEFIQSTSTVDELTKGLLSDLGFSLQFGAFGTVIAFLATMLGLTCHSDPTNSSTDKGKLKVSFSRDNFGSLTIGREKQ